MTSSIHQPTFEGLSHQLRMRLHMDTHPHMYDSANLKAIPQREILLQEMEKVVGATVDEDTQSRYWGIFSQYVEMCEELGPPLPTFRKVFLHPIPLPPPLSKIPENILTSIFSYASPNEASPLVSQQFDQAMELVPDYFKGLLFAEIKIIGVALAATEEYQALPDEIKLKIVKNLIRLKYLIQDCPPITTSQEFVYRRSCLREECAPALEKIFKRFSEPLREQLRTQFSTNHLVHLRPTVLRALSTCARAKPSVENKLQSFSMLQKVLNTERYIGHMDEVLAIARMIPNPIERGGAFEAILEQALYLVPQYLSFQDYLSILEETFNNRDSNDQWRVINTYLSKVFQSRTPLPSTNQQLLQQISPEMPELYALIRRATCHPLDKIDMLNDLCHRGPPYLVFPEDIYQIVDEIFTTVAPPSKNGVDPVLITLQNFFATLINILPQEFWQDNLPAQIAKRIPIIPFIDYYIDQFHNAPGFAQKVIFFIHQVPSELEKIRLLEKAIQHAKPVEALCLIADIPYPQLRKELMREIVMREIVPSRPIKPSDVMRMLPLVTDHDILREFLNHIIRNSLVEMVSLIPFIRKIPLSSERCDLLFSALVRSSDTVTTMRLVAEIPDIELQKEDVRVIVTNRVRAVAGRNAIEIISEGCTDPDERARLLALFKRYSTRKFG